MRSLGFAFSGLSFGQNSHVHHPGQTRFAPLAKILALQRAGDDHIGVGDRRLPGLIVRSDRIQRVCALEAGVMRVAKIGKFQSKTIDVAQDMTVAWLAQLRGLTDFWELAIGYDTDS